LDLFMGLFLKASMLQELTVELGAKSYPIQFFETAVGAGESRARETGGKWPPLRLVADEGSRRPRRHSCRGVCGHSAFFQSPPGRKRITRGFCPGGWDFLAGDKISRQDVLWVVGGGVTGDLGGFAAASYCVASITSSADDVAGDGGQYRGRENRVEPFCGKNLVGAFHHPRAVFIAPDFLRTLPPREFAAGMAEVIKYGLLATPRFSPSWKKRRGTCAARICRPLFVAVASSRRRWCAPNEFERASEGGRALLNLGHTFGPRHRASHRLRRLSSRRSGPQSAWSGAARLSQKLGLLPEPDVARIEAVLAGPSPAGAIARAAGGRRSSICHDPRPKKNRADGLRFVVLSRIGEAATRSGIPAPLVESVWCELGAV